LPCPSFIQLHCAPYLSLTPSELIKRLSPTLLINTTSTPSNHPIMSSAVSPADVLNLKGPTKEFLCPLSANTYGIDFLSFKIRDMDTQHVVFEVSKDPNAAPPQYPPGFDMDQLRSIAYKFPVQFLRYETVGTTLRFRVGPQEVHNFRMIERHYHNGTGQLMKSYDFNFHFCIPNSTNEWEAIYDMPSLSESEVSSLVQHGSCSDSFYFVDGKLIMHNKASYQYVNEEGGDNGNNALQASASMGKR